MPDTPCKQCAGKGYMRVRNPNCRMKFIRLPCDRCAGSKIDPGPEVPMEQLPYIDVDVESQANPKRREW